MAAVEPGIAVFITGVALSAFSTLIVALRYVIFRSTIKRYNKL
jgi:hypothetical protein